MAKLKKRDLIVAFGVERRNKAWRHRILESYLDELVEKRLARRTKPEFEYECKTAHYQYLVKFIFSKDQFLKALDRPNAIVIYYGHSRWGQGPAFDPRGQITTANKCPDPDEYGDANPWEEHVRMGWDIASTACIEDILDHCTNPKGFTGDVPPYFTYYEHRGKFRRAISKNKPLHKPLKNEIANKINKQGKKTLVGRYHWTTERDNEGNLDYKTFVVAGNCDLRGVDLKCSVLFMNSCSSLPRFYCALLNRKIETNSRCVFYLTMKTSYAISESTVNFVSAILERNYDPARESDGRIIEKWINLADKITEKKYPNFKHTDPSGKVTFLPHRRRACRKWTDKC